MSTHRLDRDVDDLLLAYFAPMLADVVGRDALTVRREGLRAEDFGAQELALTFEDGSRAVFRYALAVPVGGLLAVFTEHCGYHLFATAGLTWKTQPISRK